MTISQNTAIRVTVKQNYLGQQVLNVYHYLADQVVLTPDLLAFNATFSQNVVQVHAPLQNTSVNFDTLLSEQLNNGLNFLETVLGFTGSVVAAEPVASFVAVSVKFIPTTRATRPGGKRFPGLVEVDLLSNQLSSAAKAAWDGIMPNFTQTLTDGQGVVWSPVIFKDVLPA